LSEASPNKQIDYKQVAPNVHKYVQFSQDSLQEMLLNNQKLNRF